MKKLQNKVAVITGAASGVAWMITRGININTVNAFRQGILLANKQAINVI